MRDQFYKLLKQKIEEHGRREMNRLASGRLDHDGYKSACGKLAAFNQVLEDLEAIGKQISAQDDDLPENVSVSMDDMMTFSVSTPRPEKLDDTYFTPIETPIPEGLPTPFFYRMFVMPVQIRRVTKGGILLASQSVDAQLWLHAIGRIVAMGPRCFKSPRYVQMGVTEEMQPKVGDLILYSAKTPTRFHYKEVNLIVLNDDQYIAHNLNPDTLDDYNFYA